MAERAGTEELFRCQPKNKKTSRITPQTAQEAFVSIKLELDALGPDDLLQINIDIPSGCVIAVGAAERPKRFRDQILGLSGCNRNAHRDVRQPSTR